MPDETILEEDLFADIRELLTSSNSSFSVRNVRNRLLKKYHLGTNQRFVDSKKIRQLILKVEGVEVIDTGCRLRRYRCNLGELGECLNTSQRSYSGSESR